MNCYDMLAMVRDSIGEAVAAHWTDDLIVQRINLAQNSVGRIMANNPGQWLTKRATVTPVAGAVTLPSDCARPLHIEEVTSGRPISWISSVASRAITRQSSQIVGSYQDAYPLRNTIEINSSDYVTSCYLWYEMRVPDMVTGTAPAGAASSLTMQSLRHVKRVDDYYNDVYLEVMSGTGAGARTLISDYTGSTRVCVVTGTFGNDSVYGTESLLPDEAERLIELIAIQSCLSKPGAMMDEKSFSYYAAERDKEEKQFKEWLSSRIPGQSHVQVTEIGL